MADQHCLPYGAIANFDGALQEAQSFSEKTACRGSVLDKLISPLQQIRNYYKRLSNKLRIKSSKFYLAETEIVQGENKEEQYRKIKWLRFSKTDESSESSKWRFTLHPKPDKHKSVSRDLIVKLQNITKIKS